MEFLRQKKQIIFVWSKLARNPIFEKNRLLRFEKILLSQKSDF
jgi:hypothetical protein